MEKNMSLFLTKTSSVSERLPSTVPPITVSGEILVNGSPIPAVFFVNRIFDAQAHIKTALEDTQQLLLLKQVEVMQSDSEVRVLQDLLKKTNAEKRMIIQKLEKTEGELSCSLSATIEAQLKLQSVTQQLEEMITVVRQKDEELQKMQQEWQKNMLAIKKFIQERLEINLNTEKR